ncbi:MAG TPA: SPOR domain-containing protein [Casimicrobium huifangae]|jgi:DedD protein|uniref:SPOR domain-containing protein n=1 Tax=Casimicrobium huifangae TaxID=2591109 RepID=UPI0012EC9058|nr:SPOR domain-containing protein [Casimicrobium huifangae]HOB02628.1 SPOR domain-containing protein [Casimicrobium huifangae]HQA34644.1 SPOR domain-containing protein [Casimicrobium huifangae]HQD65141.1 SPOR domain-containing protein [Casimicrobium huifangae]
MAAAAPNIDEPQRADQLRRRANRRLLGASVLLLIAIVAVPMFLEREPPPLPDNVDVRIPPVEGTKFDPKFPDGKKAAADKPAEIASISEPTGAQAGAPAAVAAAVPDKAPAKVVADTSPAKPATATAPATKVAEKPAEKAPTKANEKAPAKSAPVTAAEPVRKPGQLVVQVIAVRDPTAAKQAYDRVKALKFPVYTEKIDVSNGVVVRVRAGPYDSKQAAEAARAKLAQAGFEAKVVTLQ